MKLERITKRVKHSFKKASLQSKCRGTTDYMTTGLTLPPLTGFSASKHIGLLNITNKHKHTSFQ